MTKTITRRTSTETIETSNSRSGRRGRAAEKRGQAAAALLALGFTAATGFIGYQAVAGGDRALTDNSDEVAERQRHVRLDTMGISTDASDALAETLRFERLRIDDPDDQAERQRNLRLAADSATDTSADRAERLRMERFKPGRREATNSH